MKTFALALTILAALPLAAAAQVSKEDLKKLSAAGISDDVILSYVRANGGVAKLSADDVVELKNAGASEKVLAAALGTAQAPAAPPARSAPSAPSAPQSYYTPEYSYPSSTYVYDSSPYYYTPSVSYAALSIGPVWPFYYSSYYYPRYYNNCYRGGFYGGYSSPRFYSRGSVGVSNSRIRR